MPDGCHVYPKKSSQALNPLTNHNIYIKADKSKAEMKEFQRLGKGKKKVLVQYPTLPDTDARVVLIKGSLKFDRVEVDKCTPVQSHF